MDCSIVVPLYNEESGLRELLEQLSLCRDKLSLQTEVIAVNDCSKDKTLDVLLDAQKQYAWLKVVDLQYNTGQHRATYAGWSQAKGEIILTIDGDLQNDPADIPRMIEEFKQSDVDVLCGWRQQRAEGFVSRRLPSLITNHLINGRSRYPVHDYGCYLRVYSRDAIQLLLKNVTRSSWFPTLFPVLGFKVAESSVQSYPRPGNEGSHHTSWMRIHQFLSVYFTAVKFPMRPVAGVCMLLVFLGLLFFVGALFVQSLKGILFLLAFGGVFLGTGILVGVLYYLGELFYRMIDGAGSHEQHPLYKVKHYYDA